MAGPEDDVGRRRADLTPGSAHSEGRDGEAALGVWQQGQPRLGQRHRARRSREQRNADLVFELLDPLAERGRGQGHAPGRPRKPEDAGGCDEAAQVIEGWCGQRQYATTARGMADSLPLPDSEASAPRIAAGLFGGFVLLALVNAGAIAVSVPIPAAGLSLRLAHHGFDAAETLGLGAVFSAGVGVAVKLVPRPTWVLRSVGFLLAMAMVNVVIGEYLGLQAAHLLSGQFERPVLLFTFVFLGAAFIEEAAGHRRRGGEHPRAPLRTRPVRSAAPRR